MPVKPNQPSGAACPFATRQFVIHAKAIAVRGQSYLPLLAPFVARLQQHIDDDDYQQSGRRPKRQ